MEDCRDYEVMVSSSWQRCGRCTVRLSTCVETWICQGDVTALMGMSVSV